MPIIRFPHPENSSPEGLLAVGGDLHPQSLLLAYRQGIFPWPVHDPDFPEKPPVLAWFCPQQRAVLEFQELHIPKSLEKAKRKCRFEFRIDCDFKSVIEFCSAVPRPGQSGTWITEDIKQAYIKLHKMGYAHSFEAWENDQLVGGLYGVAIDGTFAGESMFHKRDNASKLVIMELVNYFSSKGLTWIDIQTLTPHMKTLGAKEIPRAAFLQLLKQTQLKGLQLF